MAGKRIVIGGYMPALDLTGAPVSGAKLRFFQNETTTLASVYTSAALTVAHPNPVIADAAGQFPSIFADEDEVFSVEITDSNDLPISGLRNRDGIRPSLAFLDGIDVPVSDPMAEVLAQETLADAREQMGADLAANVNFTPLGTGAVVRDLQDKSRDWLSLWDFTSAADKAALLAGTSTPDLTSELQAAVDAAVSQKKALHLPGTHPNTDIKISSAIAVSGPLRIFGEGEGVSRIICIDCDGFTFSAGVSTITLEGFNIALATRYIAPDGTITANSRAAFRINGTALAPCYRYHFRNVFIDGFQYGIRGTFLSQSSFDISTIFVFGAIYVSGQSVNNVVLGSSQLNGVDSINTDHAAGSTGVRVGDGSAPQPEGFTVQPGTLIFGFKRAVRVHGAINVTVAGSILDGIGEYVFLEQGSDDAPSFGNNYVDNYCGMTGACEIAFYLTTTATAFRNDCRGTTMRNNELAIYADSTLSFGYYIDGPFIEAINIVDGKLIQGREANGDPIYTIVRDCIVTGGRNHRFTGNVWNPTTGFETAVPVQYEENTGRLAVGGDLVFSYEQSQKITYGTAAPTTGSAAVGDRHINTAPAASGNIGWVCVTAGSPGTWKAYGAIEA